jgi:hypothetical protein
MYFKVRRQSENFRILIVIEKDKLQVKTLQALPRCSLLLEQNQLKKYFQVSKTYNKRRNLNSKAKFIKLTIKFDQVFILEFIFK